ncbi:MAG: hypothetical protein KatS3mg058_2824 [Roseiflexus sp.]|nr:MAG: hypothetical protein KatS3mg058_2824 [Roseiflexus sp.]
MHWRLIGVFLANENVITAPYRSVIHRSDAVASQTGCVTARFAFFIGSVTLPQARWSKQRVIANVLSDVPGCSKAPHALRHAACTAMLFAGEDHSVFIDSL